VDGTKPFVFKWGVFHVVYQLVDGFEFLVFQGGIDWFILLVECGKQYRFY
jgi:hypothetical protein